MEAVRKQTATRTAVTTEDKIKSAGVLKVGTEAQYAYMNSRIRTPKIVDRLGTEIADDLGVSWKWWI